MATLGEALIDERKKRNVTLESIAQKTNIGIKSLKALEKDDYSQIPGDFYLKNYIKSYLNAVGCDEKSFIQNHCNTIETVIPGNQCKTNAYYSKLKYSRFSNKNFMYSISLLGILVILTIIIFYVGKDNFHAKLEMKKTPVTLPVIPTVFMENFKTDMFDLDYFPIHANIEVSDYCWIQVKRGNVKLVAQLFKKGDTVALKGYELKFYIGNPQAIKLFLNDQRVSYLDNLTKAESFNVNPSTLDAAFKR